MRFPSEIAFRALQLAKYAQNNDMTNPTSLAMYLPKAAQDAVQGIVPQGRRLEEKGASSMRGSVSVPLTQGENDDFFAALKGPYADKLKKCDINLEDVTTSVMSMVLSPDDLDDEEQGTLLLSAFGNDVNQPRCTEEDLTAATEAAQGYLSCTGVDTFIGRVALLGNNGLEKVYDNIGEKCSSASQKLTGSVTSMAFLSDSESSLPGAMPSMTEVNECLGAIFGPNNYIGDFVRNVYEHPKVFCDCSQEFAAAVPDCTMDMEGVIVSLSMIKTSACIMEIGCEEYLDHCKIENTSLDKCLPDLEADDFDCSEVMMKCANEGSVFPMIPASVSTTIPDICQADVTTKVSERYSAFQNRCKGKKDFFTDEFNEDEDEDEELQEMKAVTSGASMSKSASVSQEVQVLKSEKKEESPSSSHHFGLAGAFVLIVGTALVMIKKKYYDQDNEFTSLSTGGFEYETSA